MKKSKPPPPSRTIHSACEIAVAVGASRNLDRLGGLQEGDKARRAAVYAAASEGGSSSFRVILSRHSKGGCIVHYKQLW
jgi:hypothetical protein